MKLPLQSSPVSRNSYWSSRNVVNDGVRPSANCFPNPGCNGRPIGQARDCATCRGGSIQQPGFEMIHVDPSTNTEIRQYHPPGPCINCPAPPAPPAPTIPAPTIPSDHSAFHRP